jgi:hypothetical protein
MPNADPRRPESVDAAIVSVTETTFPEDVRRKLLEATENEILDQEQLREQEDWNYLANQIVGAEDL